MDEYGKTNQKDVRTEDSAPDGAVENAEKLLTEEEKKGDFSPEKFFEKTAEEISFVDSAPGGEKTGEVVTTDEDGDENVVRVSGEIKKECKERKGLEIASLVFALLSCAAPFVFPFYISSFLLFVSVLLLCLSGKFGFVKAAALFFALASVAVPLFMRTQLLLNLVFSVLSCVLMLFSGRTSTAGKAAKAFMLIACVVNAVMFFIIVIVAGGITALFKGITTEIITSMTTDAIQNLANPYAFFEHVSEVFASLKG